MHSWAPLSCGEAGRVNSTSISLLDPPEAQAREPAEADGGERRLVIDPDDLRQTGLAHQAAKRVQRALALLVRPGTALSRTLA